MEVFVRDVPEQFTHQSLRNALQIYMGSLSIKIYHCQKQAQKRYALLTFLRPEDGQRFLDTYGQVQPRGPSTIPPKVRVMGMPVYCSISNNQVNKYLLRSLAKEEKDLLSQSQAIPGTKPMPGTATKKEKSKQTITRTFTCSAISCGIWGYVDSDVCFIPYFKQSGDGEAKFGSRSLTLTFRSGQRVDFLYASTMSITTEDAPNPSITVTLWESPRMYESGISDSMQELMAGLSVSGQSSSQRKRVGSLSKEHAVVAGCCLVYRVALTDVSSKTRSRLQALQTCSGMPSMVHQQTIIRQPRKSFSGEQAELSTVLLNSKEIPWIVKFQLRRLSMNGFLTPNQTLKLLPDISKMCSHSSVTIASSAVRKMCSNQIPFPGLETDAEEFKLVTLVTHLKNNEAQSKKEEALSEGDDKNHAMIHRVTITPAGFYLYGPDVEPMNRVLRKYPKHHEFFLRVQFSDEDGEPVRYNPRVSNDLIFGERFKNILKNGFNIMGRRFNFLGFSHSSLRAQSCWFMTPFWHDGSLLLDRMLIQQLGEFTKIRCPAKCAARIGQAFSETPTSVTFPKGVVQEMKDVIRGDRVFSDGVGTMSKSVMRTIWKALPDTRKFKPTCFQVRCQGAKGMLSLDNRLSGDQVFLRPSMIKFEGYGSMDIEICGASYKALPMFLNRQTIKIMEDIGVEDAFFLELQSQEIERLRKTTISATNAANFLNSQSIGDRCHFPWLIKKLDSLGLEFRSDQFLCDVLEMSVLMEVKTLKHRARYPVPNGLTLYGIMDETGILEENQIFCIFRDKAGTKRVVVKKKVLITRSPALHPGDVQIVEAVNVPNDSPLSYLSNCICFSQKGDRDLPSKLSGGDLDGDLYNIIWDSACRPNRYCIPADYPRQPAMDIGREVKRDDMTDFFVSFMETDQLGRIATAHQILADQREEGTLDQSCRLLAEMHSTAVDFSKTGVPVDMKQMPKFSPIRPDFMALGQQVRVEKKEGLLLEAVSVKTQEEDNDDNDFTPYRYYESDKILGKLYRAINEHEVFSEIKKYRMLSGDNASILGEVWTHVQSACRQRSWRHHLSWAQDIREMYENCLHIIMTTYSEHPSRPISELEAFIGNILGASGSQSKKQRDLSVTMKEAYDRDAAFIVSCIINDDEGDHADDSLERSIACFAVGLAQGKHAQGSGRRGEQGLVSFGYIAAAVCLRELESSLQ